jgi:hypothetical protein
VSFTIEKNVPIPASTAGRGPIYPFAAMGVGDSFLVPVAVEAAAKRASGLSRAASAHAKKTEGRKYTVRKVKDEGGVRVWRTA